VKLTLLQKIENEINNCTRCDLYQSTICGVPGEGNSKAKIMFIGEAPGATENKTGKPFSGRAGKLIDKGLEAIKLRRNEVFITNIVKHRPPKNRNPLPKEIMSCKIYLENEIKLINPTLIVTLGNFATEHFIQKSKISTNHGKLIVQNGFNIYPVFHPSAALRKKDFMESFMKDFLNIPNVLNKIK